MRVRKHPMIPLTAVAAGLLAGAVGTVCLDAVQYLKYRRAGGTDSPVAWEFAPVENWESAPDPGQAAKRVIEGITQRKLPDRSAWLISTIAHWGYGSAAGAAYGIVAGSLPRPHPRYGLARGYISGTRFGRGPHREVAFQPAEFPEIRATPEITATGARFSQTTGGRTGAPMPRSVSGKPFLQRLAPTVWTTLTLTIGADGSTGGR